MPAPLLPLANLVRSISTPEFSGITFHEVTAKSVLNKVVAGSTMPFSWTVNPYRGCSHACVYCFARKTHNYLDLDSGIDFDSQVVVKVNAAEVLRRELSRPGWSREHVALGTNTDPYQRAEGRYRLMPGIISALADTGTPFSVLTKGTLLARDIPDLAAASRDVPLGLGISLAMLNEELQAVIEPGTPGPRARLRLISRLREAGLPCGVMAMPILPYLSDSDEDLDALFRSLAAAGATGVSAGALFLRPGSREWFFAWLAREHPALVGKYRRLYKGGSYAASSYRHWLADRVAFFKARHGFSGSGSVGHHDHRLRSSAAETEAETEAQLPRPVQPGGVPYGRPDEHSGGQPGEYSGTELHGRPGTIPASSYQPDPRLEEAQYPLGSVPDARLFTANRSGLPGGAGARTRAQCTSQGQDTLF